jgi:hypothetical protein
MFLFLQSWSSPTPVLHHKKLVGGVQLSAESPQVSVIRCQPLVMLCHDVSLLTFAQFFSIKHCFNMYPTPVKVVCGTHFFVTLSKAPRGTQHLVQSLRLSV